jgi:large repetitive protein
MQLNVTFDQAIGSLPTGFVSAVNYVVNYFDSLFTNNCTININVGYGECAGSALASGVLGESVTNYQSESYSSTRNALLAENASGSSTLPTTSPLSGTMFMAQAEAKALGLYSNSSALDGYCGFSSAVSWDYTTAAPSGGQFYLIGTLEHEITEIMGRQSMINLAPNFYAPMDLFRYSAPGVRDLTAGGSGSTAYFSIDNGATNLGTWNNNPNNGDLGDWYGSPYPSGGANDAANDYSSPGVTNVFSTSDITLMQALGWTTASGPVAPTITSFSPDSGVVGDGITNATTLSLAGTATASSTVNVYDGATLLGTATVNSSGAWSFTTTGTLASGSHSFTATDTVSGSTSTASSPLNVTIDTTAPAETFASTIGTNTGATSTIASGGLTKDNTLAFSGTVSDTDGVAAVQIYDGSTLLGTAAVSGGTWSYTTAALADGSHSFTAVATDTASNSTTSAVTATIDTTAPVVTQASASPSTSIEYPGDTVTVTLNLSSAVTVLGTPTLTLNDGGTATYAGGSGTNTLTFSYTVGTNDNSVSALAITAVNLPNGATVADAAGNAANLSGALATFPNLQIDPPSGPVAPTITSFSPDSGIVGDGITNATTLTLGGTATASSTVNVYDGATLLGTASVNSSGAWSFTTTGTLASGSHSFTATDTVSGTTSAASSPLSVTIDTTAPSETFSSTIGTNTGATSTIASGGLTKDNTLSLSGTVSDGSGVSSVQVYDGATLLGSATVSGSTWSFTTAVLANGSHCFTATATDDAGNATTTSAVTATVDTTAPAVTEGLVSDTGASSTDRITSNGTLTGSGDQNAVVHFTVDGNPIAGITTANASGIWTFTPTRLSNGSHTIVASETDAAGNTGRTSLTFTLDTTAPAVTESLVNNKLTGSGDANAVVHFTVDGKPITGTATANANGAWSYTPSGLTTGSHTIVASETDVAGNTGSALLTVSVSKNHRMAVIANATVANSQNIAGSTLLTASDLSATAINQLSSLDGGFMLNRQALGLNQDNYATVAQTRALGNSSNTAVGGGTLMMSDATQAAGIEILRNYIASSFVVGGLNHGGTTNIADSMGIPAAQPAFLSQPTHT